MIFPYFEEMFWQKSGWDIVFLQQLYTVYEALAGLIIDQKVFVDI